MEGEGTMRGGEEKGRMDGSWRVEGKREGGGEDGVTTALRLGENSART